MDSVTQIALGAAIGTAVLGRHAGYRAPLWGAVLGILPDLDIFIPMGGAVADFTYHRSFSHSVLVLAALSPLSAWLIVRLHPAQKSHRWQWLWLTCLVLLTHPVLDAFTIYGTQLFWPLDPTPIGLGSIFIIDPLFTVPLLAGVLTFLALRRHPGAGRRANAIGLLLSCLYLLWSAIAQQWVEAAAHRALSEQNLSHQQLLVQPTPFNTLLWRIVAVDNARYYEGFLSLFDRHPPHFMGYDRRPELLNSLQHHWPVERLRWFTRGFYKVETRDQEVQMSDLRMGLEPDYVFRFKVATIDEELITPSLDARRQTEMPLARLPSMWRRIWRQPETADEPGF